MRIFLSALLSLFFHAQGICFSVSLEDANKIAEKIWKNECSGTIEGLTHWNKGENFPSLGIGHFIWYPQENQEKFEETFPDLLIFLKNEGVTIPSFLTKSKRCPWHSREEFYNQINSSEMVILREFLLKTKDLQAIFIANRLEKAFLQMTEKLSKEEKEHVVTHFNLLKKDPKGLYALIDYLNFKGSGTSLSETYKGEGWGLLQVLQKIPLSSKNILIDFVQKAKEVLAQRVHNSPPERNERQWLKGWTNRLNTYLD